MLVHNCEFCDYKSDRRRNVKRHFLKMHQNLSSSPDNVVERPPQFSLQQPSQHSLPNIDVSTHGSGQNEVAHSDNDDTLSEYSSHGKQHDFFDAESDSESDTESGEVLESILDEIEEEFDNIIELRGRFRRSLDEIKDADTDKKKKILRKVAALIIKIFDEGGGINTEEDLESDEESDESEEDDQEEVQDDDGEEEEGVNLSDDNPFSFIKEIKLVMDEEDNEILDKAIEKAIKKRIEEKREEIDEDESSDESDNACGATEKVFKEDDKKLRQCINAVECEGCDYFKHCSNDKVDTIYRWCKHILNNGEQYDENKRTKVKVKWMPIKFHVRALADPKQSLDAKRKLLQKASVGDGVLSGLAALALPMMKTFFRAMRDRD